MLLSCRYDLPCESTKKRIPLQIKVESKGDGMSILNLND